MPEIFSDSELPPALNTQAKQEKRARQIAAAFYGIETKGVESPKIQGFFSRTRVVKIKNNTKVVVQFRSEPLSTECFIHARKVLGEVVPEIHYIEDKELEQAGLTVYTMTYMPGNLWSRADDGKLEHIVSMSASLGSIMAGGYVQEDSSAVLDEYISPKLRTIVDSLNQECEVLRPELLKLVEAAPRLKILPLWVAHSDMNGMNMLVDDDYKVSGIVDWEESRDLPLGAGLHRIFDNITTANVKGEPVMTQESLQGDVAFWKSFWAGVPSATREIVSKGNNLDLVRIAMQIGQVLFSFENGAQPDQRQLNFLRAALSYRLPEQRANGQEPFDTYSEQKE